MLYRVIELTINFINKNKKLQHMVNSLRSDSQNPSLAGESLSSFSIWYTSTKRGFSQYSNFTEQTKSSAVLLNLKMAKWLHLNPWIITCKPKMNQVEVRTYKFCWTFWTSNFPPLWMCLQKQWINIDSMVFNNTQLPYHYSLILLWK